MKKIALFLSGVCFLVSCQNQAQPSTMSATTEKNMSMTKENIYQFKVKDLSGKTILEQTQNTNQINTQNLASGIYFLEAIANNKIYKTKFIKK